METLSNSVGFWPVSKGEGEVALDRQNPIGRLGKGWSYWLNWSGNKVPFHFTLSFRIFTGAIWEYSWNISIPPIAEESPLTKEKT